MRLKVESIQFAFNFCFGAFFLLARFFVGFCLIGFLTFFFLNYFFSHRVVLWGSRSSLVSFLLLLRLLLYMSRWSQEQWLSGHIFVFLQEGAVRGVTHLGSILLQSFDNHHMDPQRTPTNSSHLSCVFWTIKSFFFVFKSCLTSSPFIFSLRISRFCLVYASTKKKKWITAQAPRLNQTRVLSPNSMLSTADKFNRNIWKPTIISIE